MANLLSNHGVSRVAVSDFPLDLPEGYIQGIKDLYQYSQDGKQGKPMGDLFICFETKRDSLARFGIVN